MTPCALTLEGFIGIRDGLGRDAITIDLTTFAAATLIAIVGPNGRGKSTVLDNLTPYLLMPSHAGAGGRFSYYDHVYLPVSRKRLEWRHDGVLYRSDIIFRLGASKKTEAYLFRAEAEHGWRPAMLADGTVADGKVETYNRCVEAIAGSQQTFFTSVFTAQQQCQLAAYDNADIKALLTDMLGEARIRALGAAAADVAKQLRNGLAGLRDDVARICAEQHACRTELEAQHGTAATLPAVEDERNKARHQLGRRQGELATVTEQEASREELEQRRAACHDQCSTLRADGTRQINELHALAALERGRAEALEQRVVERERAHTRQLAMLAKQEAALAPVLDAAPRTMRAARRCLLRRAVMEQRATAHEQQGDRVKFAESLRAKLTLAQERRAAVVREAGQAVLQHAALGRRHNLCNAVPCVGTDLQPRCHLLSDARLARAQQEPVAQRMGELKRDDDALVIAIDSLAHQLIQHENDDVVLQHLYSKLVRSCDRFDRYAALAARSEDLGRARAQWAALAAQRALLDQFQAGATPQEQREREAIDNALVNIDNQLAHATAYWRSLLDKAVAALEALPAPLTGDPVGEANRALAAAQLAAERCEARYVAAIAAERTAQLLHGQLGRLTSRLASAEQHAASVAVHLERWALCAKGLGNDGVLALLIDDAGPALAGHANQLLLACYGPRFTLSIHTQRTGAKGAVQEGFEIKVYDADRDTTKNVLFMSGGERVWINVALVRAIAIHLSTQGGTRHATLFSDEADGALDVERKRMFMAMKREVLRLGQYQQEYFISHTPELTAMADAVLDLDTLVQQVACS